MIARDPLAAVPVSARSRKAAERAIVALLVHELERVPCYYYAPKFSCIVMGYERTCVRCERLAYWRAREAG